MGDNTEASESARAAADAIQRLCRATLTRSSMIPAEVDAVLADLAAAVAALPQAARQLGGILEQAKTDHLLEMDGLTETENPDLAIDAARLHLDAVREPALDLHRALDAAHNETAHIATANSETGNTESAALRPTTFRPSTGGPTAAADGQQQIRTMNPAVTSRRRPVRTLGNSRINLQDLETTAHPMPTIRTRGERR